MKSKQFRILEEINNIKYRFCPDAFEAAIAQFVNDKRVNDKSYTKNKAMLLISELGFSFDAIKKWKQGYNGPGSIDTVKDVARILNIDYTSLLSPEEDKEVITQVDNNILKIYQESLLAVFRWAEKTCGCISRSERKPFDAELLQDLSKVSESIDMYGLLFSKSTASKLHRIVFDLCEILDHRLPERWEMEICLNGDDNRIPDCFGCMMLRYNLFKNRADAVKTIKSWEMEWSYYYLADEIDMAIDLGYSDVREYDDMEAFNEFSLEEQLKYGYVGNEIEITPLMLFKHMFTDSLCLVFRHDFGFSVPA